MLSYELNFAFLLPERVSVCMVHACHGVGTAVKGQPRGVGSILLCRFWGANPGCQAWQQDVDPPSHLASMFHLI